MARRDESNGSCIDEEKAREREEATLADAISDQMGSAPWYVSSLAVHSFIFMILLLIPVPFIDDPQLPDKLVVGIEDPSPSDIESPPDDPQPPIDVPVRVPDPAEDLKVKDVVVITTVPVVLDDHMETPDEAMTDKSFGDPTALSDTDAEFAGTPAVMGSGKSGGPGGGGLKGGRFGGQKRKALKDGGGGKPTEDVVDHALRWLAAHQEYDGHWDCVKYGGGKHRGDDIAVTSLALLAFLGKGNSTKFGRYRSNVKRAVKYLLAQQKADGGCDPYRYTGGLYLMALAEAYGMSETRALKEAAQRAVDWAVAGQNATGGWDYLPGSNRTDTSVTGWWIMGLKSAKVSYLNVPEETLAKAISYMRKATPAKGGKASYASTGGTIKEGGGSNRMAAVALTCLQFLGAKRTDPQVRGTAEYAYTRLPDPGHFDFYEWYYQALGLLQMGTRSKYWQHYNEPMKKALLGTQVMDGTYEENKGSWNPDTDKYGPSWGRVGQTALGALTLEVYYRYAVR